MRIPAILLSALAIAAGACGGGDGSVSTSPSSPSTPSAPSTPTLTSITVTLSASSLAVGQTATASAAGVDQNGSAISTGTVTWSSTSNAVATVTSSGIVTAVAAGQTTIIASAGGKQGQAVVTVTAASFAVCPSTITVSQNINAATTWSPGAAGCLHYRVTTPIFVGAALAIQPGTVVGFAAGAGLTVTGSLSAVGAAAAPIRMVGEQSTRGYWKGIQFNSNSTLNELTYVTVSYGGGGTESNPANVEVGQFEQLRMTNTTLEQSAGAGLYAGSSASLPGFAANTLRNNAGPGVRIPDHLMGSMDVASSYSSGNGVAYLDVFAAGIDNAQRWSVTSAPIRFTGTTFIFGNLTVAPGVTVQFGPNAQWVISGSGSLSAIGTASARIQFVGQQSTRGFWKGIVFNSNSTLNELTYATVAYGGGGTESDPANVEVGQFEQLRLTNTTVEQSAGAGFFAGASATLPGFAANVFRNNAGPGVRVADHLVGSLDVASTYDTGNGVAYIDAFASGVNNSQRWSVTAVPIRFTGTTFIFGNLTLAPGVTVQFGPNAQWVISGSGSLSAVGTATSRIQLIGQQSSRGFWKGIQFNSNSTQNELTYVTVSYGGGGTESNPANVEVGQFEQLRLTNSILEQSAGAGFFAGSSAVLPGFAANTFRNNAAAGVQVADHLVGSLDVASTYDTGNGVGYIDVFASGINNAQRWSVIAVPIRFTGTTFIFGNLTLAPGVTVQFGPNAQWVISGSGSLSAIGTAAARIQLIGQQSTRGYWKGIQFNSNSAQNELTYATVAYGGGGSESNPANVEVGQFEQLRLTNTTLRDSQGWGIYVSSNGVLTPTPTASAGNSFANNALGNSNIP